MMAALSLTSSLSLVVVNVNLTSSASAAIHTKHNDSSLFAAARCTCTKPSLLLTSFRIHPKNRKLSPRRGLIVLAVTGEQEEQEEQEKQEEEEQSIPSWAKPDSDEPPPWARHESPQTAPTFEPPFFVYLLASAITAIAAIGSVFEYVNQRPVFGVLNSDSVFYAPLLGFFAFTGIPTSAFLWFKSVQVANKEAEEQDRRDGYL